MPSDGFKFELFDKIGASGIPRASIRSNGDIGFNLTAQRKFELHKFRWVCLYFDWDRRAIAIRLFEVQNVFKSLRRLTIQRNDCHVFCKPFLTDCEVPYRSRLKAKRDAWTFVLKRYSGMPNTIYIEDVPC